MSDIIEFRVQGIPKGQPRPRAFSRGGSARVYDPGSAEGWKGDIAICAKSHRPPTPIDGPVKLSVLFRLPRPKSRCRKCDPTHPLPAPVKPDVDNATKAVMDCLTTLGFWKDDNQVICVDATKVYHAIGDVAGADIRIEYGNFPYTSRLVDAAPAQPNP